jgi:hypothetical protein
LFVIERAASGSPLAATWGQLHTHTVFNVPKTLCSRQRCAGALPLLFRVTATPESQICEILPLTHPVVHPSADAGAVSMTIIKAKAAPARMSFFIIGSPL